MRIPMKQVAYFMGTVPVNFFGNVQYHTELRQPYRSLRLELAYMDNKPDIPGDLLSQSITDAYLEYQGQPLDDASLPEIYAHMKTEIQLTVLLDGEFAGTIHRPGTHKEILITPSEQTPGCVYPKNQLYPGTLQGHLTVIVNFFGVLVEQTPYSLTVYAE